MLTQIENLIRQRINQKAFPVLAKITKIYTDKDKYYIDCKELNYEGEETSTMLTRVPLPKFWGTMKGGIWMTPSTGATVLVSFLGGDKNFPIVSSVMGSTHEEIHPENTLLIKIGETSLEINDGSILIKSKDQELNLSDKISLANNLTTLKSILEDMVDDLPNVVCPNGGPSTVTPSINSITIKNKINMLMS
ncbi:MAG: hypothetical protein ACRCS8_02075 [Brevinema sp.]